MGYVVVRENSLRSSLLAAILLFVAGLGVIAGVELFDRQHSEQLALRDVANELRPHRDRLEATLEAIVRLNRLLSAEIVANPAIGTEQLQRISEKLVLEQPRIASVVVTNKLTVISVHPLKGNEALIGLDYGLHPEFMGGMRRAIDFRNTIVAGPVELLESARPGLVVRTPVFTPSTKDHAGEFWGLVSMAVDLEGLLAEAGLLDPAHSFSLAIAARAGGNAKGEFVFGDPKLFKGSHVTANVTLPDGDWQIGAAPKLDTGYDAARSWLIRGIGISITLVVMFLVSSRVRSLLRPPPEETIPIDRLTIVRQLPLRTILLVSLLLALPITAGIAAWFSYQTATREAEQFEQQHVAELGKQIRGKVTGFFEVPRRVVSFNVELFRSGFIDPQKQDLVIRNFLLQLRQQPLLTFLSVGTADGEYLSAGRPPSGADKSLRAQLATIAERRVQRIYRVDDANRWSTLLSVSSHFDARTRPWFKAGAASDGIQWYPPYRYAAGGPSDFQDLGIGVAAPLYDAKHAFVGVVAADVALSQLSGFLKAQIADIGGVVFLAESGGELLATSGVEPIYLLSGDRTNRIKMTESDNAVIRTAGGVIQSSTQSQGNVFTDVGCERYLVDWQTIRLPDGPVLYIGIALPQSRYAGPATDALRDIIYLTVALLVLGMVAILLASEWVTRPLVSLNRWARQLAAGDWQARPPVSSPIQEVTNLSSALGHMAEDLKRNTVELEQRVAERTLELEQANQQLAALSVTDGLTGIANRRHFDAVLAVEWARASRTRQPMALMMLDVDLFKRYNDHYGHQAGDEALKSVAGVLKESARRPSDLAARYGGEEFVVIAANTDATSAQRIAETIRGSVESLAIPHEKSPNGRVTVSIGIAVSAPDNQVSSEKLVSMADEALYHAKETGRNRVELLAACRT